MLINFTDKFLDKRPNLILRNLDGTAIAYLGHALNLTGKFCYNEISEIQFEYPSKVNGVDLPEYNLLTGMRVIDVQGYGQFLIKNPKANENGVVKKKQCQCYSLEYELTYKNITLEEGTYNFWNRLAPEGTILGIIVSDIKSWNIGTVSKDLIGKYRTFSVEGKNVYDWMKTDLQETFGCIFDFDTYNRTINVRSINDIVHTKPVYLSTANLVKDIEIEENTDELVTELDVSGAEGVSIRSVNPLGTNRIYNLDAYMNKDYFSDRMIAQWKKWKDTFNTYQQSYYQLVIAQNMQTSRKLVEESVLTDLKNELEILESKKAITIQAMATDSALQSDLDEINGQIRSKESEIDEQNYLIESIKRKIDSYVGQLKNINQITSFDSFFNQDELVLLDRYFRCGTLAESTFVATSTNSYATETNTVRGLTTQVNISGINSIEESSSSSNSTFYTIKGGMININDSSNLLNAKIVHGTLQTNSDSSFILSLYLEHGKYEGTSFPGGTAILAGNKTGDVTKTSDSLRINISKSTLYVSQEVTEYQRMSVEWELFEYGFDCLKRLSSPTYYFSLSSINFLALDDFALFARELELGEKIYLDVEGKVLSPIVTSVSVDFDDLSNLEIDFGDTFSLNDASFKLEDLLEKSISMGSTLDFNQYNYSNFVNSGAKTQVKDFMTSAIDTMKNRILSGDHEQITIDHAGLRCRKYDETTGKYDPKQIWLAHNALMFTSNNWEDAEIGIGEFVDKNLGSIFGIVAPAIVGTILAGTQLVIESEKSDGGVAVFKVDAEGASLHNASFNLYGSSGGRIDLGAEFGIVSGSNKNTLFYYDSKGQPTGVRTKDNQSISRINDLSSNDSPNANFWLDMYGDAFFKGKILATSGSIGGWEIASSYLYSGSGSNRVAMNGGTDYYSQYAFWAGAENPANAKFWVKKNGEMCATNGTFTGILTAAKIRGALKPEEGSEGWLEGLGIKVGKNPYTSKGYNFYVDPSGNVVLNGSITWGRDNFPIKSQFSPNGITNWHDTQEDDDFYRRDVQYDGTWGDPYQFKGSDADVTRDNIAAALLDSKYTDDGLYAERINGKTCLLINASAIKAGEIKGINIRGGAFYSDTGSSKLVLGDSNYGDMTLYGSGNNKVFSVYDNIGGALFSSYNNAIFSVYNYVTSPQGTWDFSGATVKGLKAVFA